MASQAGQSPAKCLNRKLTELFDLETWNSSSVCEDFEGVYCLMS